MTAAAGIAAMALVAAPAIVSGPSPDHGAGASGQRAAAVLSAPAAAAHSALVSASPEQNATVQEAPQQITATFNEEISTEFAHLTVMLDGTNHAAGDPQVSGRELSVGVGELPPGEYTVGYRVVSADGHPVQGSWSFTLAGADGAAPAPSGNGAAATQPDQSGQAEAAADGEQTSMAPVIAMLAVFAAALIGGAFFLLRRQRKVNDQFAQDFS